MSSTENFPTGLSDKYIIEAQCEKRDFTLGKHAYSNILKILQSKKENFPIKNPIFFIFLL